MCAEGLQLMSCLYCVVSQDGIRLVVCSSLMRWKWCGCTRKALLTRAYENGHLRRDFADWLPPSAQAQLALTSSALIAASDSARLHIALLLLLRDVLRSPACAGREALSFTAYPSVALAVKEAVGALQAGEEMDPRLLLPSGGSEPPSPRLAFLWVAHGSLETAVHAMAQASEGRQTVCCTRLALPWEATPQPAALGGQPEEIVGLCHTLLAGCTASELEERLATLKPLGHASARALREACVGRLRLGLWEGAAGGWVGGIEAMDASLSLIDAAMELLPSPKQARQPLMSFGRDSEAGVGCCDVAGIKEADEPRKQEEPGDVGRDSEDGSSSSESEEGKSEKRKRKRKKVSGVDVIAETRIGKQGLTCRPAFMQEKEKRKREKKEKRRHE